MRKLSMALSIFTCCLLSNTLDEDRTDPAKTPASKENKIIDSQSLMAIETYGSTEVSFGNQTIIDSGFIDHTQAQNLTQIFSAQSSVSVGGGANMAQKIYIRGLEDRLFSVSVDGARQNGNAFHHQGNVMLDASMIKEIKLNKGVANASDGAGSLAGSIKVITKDASDFLKDNQNFGFKVKSGVFSNFGIEEGLVLYGGNHKNFDALVSYDFLDTFYYRDGGYLKETKSFPGDRVLGSNSLRHNVLFKTNAYLSKEQKITFSYGMVMDRAIAPFRRNIGSVIGEDGVDYALVLFNNQSQNHNLALNYQKKSESFQIPEIKAGLYANIKNVKLSPYSLPAAALKDPEASSARNLFLNNVGLDIKLKHQKSKKSSLEYGINYQNLSTADLAQTLRDPAHRGREVGQILGGFVQGGYEMIEGLSFGIGSRYDSYFYFDKNSQNHHTWGFSPSGFLLYEPLESLDIKLSYGYVVRGALPGDALLLQDSDLHIAKNLKAEKSQNVEFDIDYNGDFFFLRGSLFYQHIRDFINSYGRSSLAASDVLFRDNLPYAINVYGGEIGGGLNYKGFYASFDFSRSLPSIKGHLLSDTYELGAVSGNTYVLKLGYDALKWHISWVSRFVQAIDYRGYNIYNDEIENINKKGYGIHSIYASYTPIKHLELNFAIENLFNAYYISQTSPFKVEADSSASESMNAIRSALRESGINFKFNLSYQY